MPERLPLAIYGAGGFARETLELVRDINADEAKWEILGFLDDDEEKWGRTLNDAPVIGGMDWLIERSVPPHLCLGIGSPAAKRRVVERVRPNVASFATLIHPSVVRSRHVDIGEGVTIAAGNILTANIALGNFVLLNLACTVGHDCVLGSYCTIAPGVNISGNVRIGTGCDIGTGSSIVQGVGIGEWSIVGAGAAVSKDLPANCTAVGVPAKPIKQRDAGWHLV